MRVQLGLDERRRLSNRNFFRATDNRIEDVFDISADLVDTAKDVGVCGSADGVLGGRLEIGLSYLILLEPLLGLWVVVIMAREFEDGVLKDEVLTSEIPSKVIRRLTRTVQL